MLYRTVDLLFPPSGANPFRDSSELVGWCSQKEWAVVSELGFWLLGIQHWTWV